MGVCEKVNSITGVLLAGGESKRFGEPKAFAEYNGRKLWQYSMEVLKVTTEQQIIISHQDLLKEFQKATQEKILTDDHRFIGDGPKAGIYTAMKNETSEWFVILSCDIPLITADIIRRLLTYIDSDKKMIIPKIEGRVHPLIGVYHHSVFPIIEEQLESNDRKLMTLFDQVNVCFVTEKELQSDAKTFSNINSRRDYGMLLNNGKITE
ncbi:hypothetical protein CJ195_20250 [Bacillus sp. UMB0899]|nr:hypothetical protein CJ195_20250 [Bacillus sp. UMB0899]